MICSSECLLRFIIILSSGPDSNSSWINSRGNVTYIKGGKGGAHVRPPRSMALFNQTHMSVRAENL